MGYTIMWIIYSFTLYHVTHTEYSDVQQITCHIIMGYDSRGQVFHCSKVCVCTYLDLPMPSITYLILTYVPKNQQLCQEYETNLESKLKNKKKNML